MSLETDARDTMIQAIREKNNVEVGPEDFDDVKPSDPGIGAQTGAAWLATLEIATGHLEGKGYSVGRPTLEKATELREQVLLESSIHLEELCSRSLAVSFAKIAGAVAVVGAVTYAAVKATSRRRRSRRAARRRGARK